MEKETTWLSKKQMSNLSKKGGDTVSMNEHVSVAFVEGRLSLADPRLSSLEGGGAELGGQRKAGDGRKRNWKAWSEGFETNN